MAVYQCCFIIFYSGFPVTPQSVLSDHNIESSTAVQTFMNKSNWKCRRCPQTSSNGLFLRQKDVLTHCFEGFNDVSFFVYILLYQNILKGTSD